MGVFKIKSNKDRYRADVKDMTNASMKSTM
jgi:hypothetical protein